MRSAIALLTIALVGCELVAGVGEYQVGRSDGGVGGDALGGSQQGGSGGFDEVGGAGGVGGIPFVGCGDGVVLSGEECDDGNSADADGCSSSCAVECEGPDTHKHSTTFHCYRWVGTQQNWFGARQQCLALGPGWELLAQSSQAERDFIDDVVDPPSGVWTGGNDMQSEGVYAWTNGEPWGYAPWYGAGGEPDNNGNCIITWGLSGDSNDALADDDCNTLNEYICELTPAGS